MTKFKNINSKKQAFRVLVVPLDWGLGHATRCIPIIHALEELGCTVFLAGEGPVKLLLENAFTHLETSPLKGYRMRYHAKRGMFFFRMLAQLPRSLRRMKQENRWLKQVVKENKIDWVISDNRPGLYHKEIPSVYITHQLQIETGNIFLNAWAQKIQYRFIKKFTACWVPDVEKEPSLAGKLSHPKNLPAIPVSYVGILSRLKIVTAYQQTDLLILLSGPEPQRTILEQKLLEQLSGLNLSKAVLVRGLPGTKLGIKKQIDGLTVHNYLNSQALEKEIAAAKHIVCRSGYSSLMDLVKLNKTALLIPTPGQGEQEYLAKKLSQENLFAFQSQHKLNLQAGLKILETLHPITPISYNAATLTTVLEKFISTLHLK